VNNKINHQWLLGRRPNGAPRESDFVFHEVALSEPGEGEFLVRIETIAFEPAMRGWMLDRPSYVPPVALGEVMRGYAVGRVIASRHPDFTSGDYVHGLFGWQEYALVGKRSLFQVTKVPPGIPPRLTLGVLGLNGLTAYFGLLDLGQPKAGETVVVSSAAGATGSIVGQIAKLKGCRVIGIAGGAEKCHWVTHVAGFDAAIDYKSDDLRQGLRGHCPQGIDVYFDNVGGETLDAVLEQIALRARIVLCGRISVYNFSELPAGPKNYFCLVTQRGRMEGFIVMDYAPRYQDALQELAGWVMAGQIKYKEDIQEGFENAPRTFLRLFSGQNFGKQLLKISE
jgi:NADPH-dependent curcumin reductase CurA